MHVLILFLSILINANQYPEAMYEVVAFNADSTPAAPLSAPATITDPFGYSNGYAPGSGLYIIKNANSAPYGEYVLTEEVYPTDTADTLAGRAAAQIPSYYSANPSSVTVTVLH